MRKGYLFILAMCFLFMRPPAVCASGQEYDIPESAAEQNKRHKAEHRNDYHVEYMAHHTHRTVGRGKYTHQHPYHDLEIPMLDRDNLLAKPKKNPDGTVSLNNKYCPVTGDAAKTEFSVEANGVIYNVACKWSIESIGKNPEKYRIDLNQFEIN